jgi:hypothetical protein
MVMAVTRKFVAGYVMEVWVLFKVCDGRCNGDMATLRVCGGRCNGSMATLAAFGIKGNGGEATC